jgi:hypothetical protein
MKWVVVAIAAFIALYTAVNLFYRKPGRGHEPAAEARARATAARLQSAGWQTLPVETRRPIEKPAVETPAAFSRGALGFGLDLDLCFVEKPPLLASIDQVTAPSAVTRGEPCTIYFTASIRDLQWQLAEVRLLRRDNELVLIPTAEHLPGKQLYSRWSDAHYCASFSTQSLPPGRYEVRLIASGPAARWTLTVR